MLRRRIRLGTILGLLVLATTIPLGLFAAGLIRASWQQQRSLVDRQNVDAARAISMAVDLEVRATIATLNVLAALETVNDRRQFYPVAIQMLRADPEWEALWLVEARSGEVLVDTDVPFGEPSDLVNPDWVRTVRETRHPAASGLRQDPATKRFSVAIGVPVLRNRAVKYVLGARVRSTAFSEVLRRQGTPEGGVVTLLDRDQTIIARTRNEDLYVGKGPTPDFAQHSRETTEGAWRTVLLEGIKAYSAHSRSPLTGWTIGIGLPAESIDAPIRRSFEWLIGAGIAILSGGIALAVAVRRRIVRAQTAASAAARALAAGEPIALPQSSIAEVDELSKGLAEAARILEHRLHERNEALRQRDALLDREKAARRAAETLSRAKDEFVATVSHELRTPLNAIFGWVAMLRAGTLDADRQKHALDVIHRNTIAQAQLIEDLLDMSRVIRGTVRLDMQPIDLAVTIDAAVDTLRPTAEARHITVQVQAERGAAIVSGDLSRLQQVIWNLLSNSLKFTPSGGHVDVRLEVEHDEAAVHITDNGEGIAPDFLPHVFDRFRQEAADVTRTHAGLGIGLSLVRHLTELHGGRVSATSEGKGHGATFTIALPLLGSRAAGVQQPRADFSTTSPRPLLGRRLLVVDDDADARDLVATAFVQGGASVTAVESVSQALASVEDETPDAVVTDIAMPSATGFDLVRQLRADDRTADLPIVAITAYNRGEDRDRALAEGFDAHVGKPFDPRAVVALVAALVEERSNARAHEDLTG